MKKELWLRLKGYHFDNLVPPHLSDRVSSMFGSADPSTRAFATKLARKLGWKNRFSLRAIEEYKKFVFLGVTSDFSVTPSKVIDQVWHEHILFSRAYREFTGSVLQRDFDHNPELIQLDQQTDVFKEQFALTIAAYEREFRTRPPHDIWGIPKFKDGGSAADDAVYVPSTATDTPLYMSFDACDSMAEFGGGGGFSGGGGESAWSSDSSSSDSSSSDSSADASSSDSGSSCSSSCGGGGCGSD